MRELLAAVLLSLPLALFAQANTNIAPSEDAFDTTSSWRMTTSRDDRAQALQIPEGTNRDGTKKFSLSALSNFTKGELVKISAELIETAQVRMLILTPATGNKIIVVQKQDGNFEGTMTTPQGQTLRAQLQKLTEKEIGEAAKLAASRTTAIKLPAADVPASCAGFIGGWTGNWPRYGSTWLWVIEIDAQCIATYAHRNGAGLPNLSVFKKAEIVNGELSLRDANGATDSFKLHGNELWASHSGIGESNSAVFRKISLEAK